LVTQRFTLALIGSINIFILHHYFLRSMLLVTTLLNGWLLQLNNFQEHGVLTGSAATNITVCQMSSLLLILFTFFNDNGGTGPTHMILSSWDLCSPEGLLYMVAGPGGRRLRGRLPQGKSPSLGATGFRQKDTQMDTPLFSNCLRCFIPD